MNLTAVRAWLALVFWPWLVDTAERSLSTLLQTLVPLVLLAWQSGATDWTALAAAGFAAIVTVLLQAIPQLRPTGLPYWADVVFRLLRTMIATGLGIAAADGFDLYAAAAWQTLAVAAVTAALVFAKAELAARRRYVVRVSPASLVARPLVS
jgi:hypothetical protein